MCRPCGAAATCSRGFILSPRTVAAEKLALASFFCDEASPEADPNALSYGYNDEHGFGARCDFVTIGGFKHPPNVDAVKWLSGEIWPLIRESLPDAQLHIYGVRLAVTQTPELPTCWEDVRPVLGDPCVTAPGASCMRRMWV